MAGLEAAIAGSYASVAEDDLAGSTIEVDCAEGSETRAGSNGLLNRLRTSATAEVDQKITTNRQNPSWIAICLGDSSFPWLNARAGLAIFGRNAHDTRHHLFPSHWDVGRLDFVNEATKPALREMGRATTIGSGNEKALMSVESAVRSADDDSAGHLLQPDHDTPLKRLGERSALEKLLRSAAGVLAVAALVGSAALLLNDAAPQLIAIGKLVVAMAPRAWALLGHAPLSAMPLLLVGGSYIALQGLLRPAPLELVKRLMLGSAFLLWGIVQLMPPGVVATDLGDLVIALYVLDLGIIVQAELRGM